MTGTRSRRSPCFALTSQSMRADGNARRSAAATGMAWTMSPNALRRTRRNRDNLLTDLLQQIARGVTFRIAHDGGPAAICLHDAALGDGVDGVIGAFAVNIRL